MIINKFRFKWKTKWHRLDAENMPSYQSKTDKSFLHRRLGCSSTAESIHTREKAAFADPDRDVTTGNDGIFIMNAGGHSSSCHYLAKSLIDRLR